MSKAIYFDMDGTVADLYGVDGWLSSLNAEDTLPYEVARPMYDMNELNAVLCELSSNGWTIGVITWTAMNGSATYNRAVRKVKQEWIKKWMPCVEEFHCVKYGTPKHKVRKVKNSILVDDNANVRADWDGLAIDATRNVLEILKKMVDTFC